MKETIETKFTDTCKNYSKDREFNRVYLRSTVIYMHDILKIQGYLFVRDVYEYLGIPVTRNILCKGWVAKDLKEEDDFISVVSTGEKGVGLIFHNVENIIEKFPKES